MFTSNIIITTVSSNFTYIYIITLSHTFVKNYFKNRIEVIMQFGKKIFCTLFKSYSNRNIEIYYIVDSKILKIHRKIFSISSLVKISIT